MFARWSRLSLSARGRRFVHEQVAPPADRWQQDAVQACMNAIQAGRTKLGIQVTEGARSTVAGLAASLQQNQDATRRQILVVCHTPQNGKKLFHKIVAEQPHLRAEVDDKKLTGLSRADVFLTTYKIVLRDTIKTGSGMSAEKKPFKQRFDKSALKAVILTDAEEFKPPSYNAFLTRFQTDASEDASSPSQHPIIIGMSSNDDLNVLRGLEWVEEVAYRRSYLDIVQKTWQPNTQFSAVPAPLGLRKVSIKMQLFFQVHVLSKIMRQRHILLATVQAWLDRAATRKSTVVYCVDEEHAVKLAQMFAEVAKVDARYISHKAMNADPGIPDSSIREREMAAFEAGEFPILLFPPITKNVVPGHARVSVARIDCVLIAAPTINRHDLAQMISSGMQPSPDKEDPLIIEMVDANQKRGQAYSLSQLFLLEPDQIDGQPADVLRQRAEAVAEAALVKLREQRAKDQAKSQPREEGEEVQEVEKVSPPPFLDVEQLPASGAVARQVDAEANDRALKTLNLHPSRRFWVRCTRGVYVHDRYERGHAIIREVKSEEGPPEYEAFWTSRRLLEGTSAEEEVTRKLSVPGKLLDIISQTAQFLKRAPLPEPVSRTLKATEAQITVLRELYPETMSQVVCEGQPMSRDAFFEWITIADASKAIARLRYAPPDAPAFSYREQADIVARIRIGEHPGAKLERKKARRAAERAIREEKEEKKREAAKLLKEKKKAKKERAAADLERRREGGEAPLWGLEEKTDSERLDA
ncbi:hypothetical protein DFH06DRAFT_668394 [Mycena polygramma]|nr:hypothetical protein DFH06DRAFT_668394 [Mycena polygramma]